MPLVGISIILLILDPFHFSSLGMMELLVRNPSQE